MKQMERIGSKEGQDDFALALCGQNKFFVDLGMGNPHHGNNTVLLEGAGWTGHCFEINLASCDVCNKMRMNPAHCIDLRHDSIEPILDVNKAPRLIDFISFDVDDATIPAIKNFPFETYSFAVMCFEHDSYGLKPSLSQDTMVARLAPWPKYVRVAQDVCFEDQNGTRHAFEDWWVNSEIIDVTKLTFHVGAAWFEILRSIAGE